MKHYLSETKEVLEEVKSSPEGLSAEEAASRLEANGKNKLNEAKKTSMFKRFSPAADQSDDYRVADRRGRHLVTVIIDRSRGGDESFAEFIIIVAVVLLNAILGVVQEGRAEHAIEALKEMTASTCKVIRGGQLLAVKSEEIVVGDIVVLEAGDSVPADCRILECASLKAEESALTGESVPANKEAEKLELGELKDIPLATEKIWCIWAARSFTAARKSWWWRRGCRRKWARSRTFSRRRRTRSPRFRSVSTSCPRS